MKQKGAVPHSFQKLQFYERMKNKMLNAVKDVFKDYKEPNNILDTKIENINLFKKSNKLEINLISEARITLDEIDRFEEYLKSRFQIQKIELNVEMGEKGASPLSPQEIKSDWKSIVKYISKKYPLTKVILNTSDVETEENKIIVVLKTKNADFLHSYEIDKEIEKIINNVYGLKIKVEFQENITEDTIKKQSEYLEELEKNACEDLMHEINMQNEIAAQMEKQKKEAEEQQLKGNNTAAGYEPTAVVFTNLYF